MTLDGVEQASWESFQVQAGQVVAIGQGDGVEGLRCYLAVSGGIDAPIYLGSRSTFPTGNIGGFQGRPLMASLYYLRAPGITDASPVLPPW